MEKFVIDLMKVSCALRFHHYGPWEDSDEKKRLEFRDCVRCGTREYRDDKGNRVESRWAAGREKM
jgi:hypothetical protein